MQTSHSHSTPAIGVFDSGVGGLSVLRAVRRLIPSQPIIYLADQAHVPYGAHTEEEVRSYCEEITRFLLTLGVRLVIVACNSASAAALHYLRATFPEVPFVGMEPAVKPAASNTHSGVVGVLATPVTFQGKMYASVVERFAQGVTVLEDACPGLVAEIEAGHLRGSETRAILTRALQPMMEKGVDTIVMGCTHYPFVIPLIQEIVGKDVQVIDPAPAIARQTQRLLDSHGWLATGSKQAEIQIFTTGSRDCLVGTLPIFLEEEYPVQVARWHYGKLS